MKALRTAGFAAIASVLFVVPPAFAQQTQQNRTNHTTTAATQGPPNLVRFPMTAAQYEHNISRQLEILRKAKPMGPITAGDYNKVILMMRDCASNAEADGVVSAKEAQGCQAQVKEYRQQRLREIMATSTPDQWARWRAALPNPTGGHGHD